MLPKTVLAVLVMFPGTLVTMISRQPGERDGEPCFVPSYTEMTGISLDTDDKNLPAILERDEVKRVMGKGTGRGGKNSEKRKAHVVRVAAHVCHIVEGDAPATESTPQTESAPPTSKARGAEPKGTKA